MLEEPLDEEVLSMATRTIKTLGKTGRITHVQARKAAEQVLRSASKTKQQPTKILTAAATASGKGLIRFRFAAEREK